MKKILALMLVLFWAGAAHGADKELVLFNWSEYMPQKVLRQFTQETGIKVSEITYESNEAMYAKVKLVDGEGYDLIVPSSDYISRMGGEGLLREIDLSKIPNFKHINKNFVDKSFDRGNRYSAPYTWGSTALMVNPKRVDPTSVMSLERLWDERFTNSLLMPDDMRGGIGLGLLALGYSINTRDEAKVKMAYEKLVKLLPNIKVFNSESSHIVFLTGEVSVGMLYSGDAYLAWEENNDLRYVYPREGFNVWMDHFAIPRGARNVDNAHAFINFIHRPEISALIAEELGYATPNQAARELLPPDFRDNPIIYPSDETMERARFEDNIGDAVTVYEKYWSRLKTR